ncbi:MAG TPA: hypothetical protein VEM93_07725 [Actinomycetota bacterium]|nr:hypothetical protein [Actinomycetota bacterium]
MAPHLNVIPPLLWTIVAAVVAGLALGLVERWLTLHPVRRGRAEPQGEADTAPPFPQAA